MSTFKTTVGEILERIPKLPADALELVHLATGGAAEVESFRPEVDLVYKTHIKTHPLNDKANEGGDVLLLVSCECIAHSLCKHICAHFAKQKRDREDVAEALAKRKGLPADPSAETVSESGKETDVPLSRRAEGLKLIAGSIEKVSEAFQDLANGIMLVKEGSDED